jgi:hypothetical protein
MSSGKPKIAAILLKIQGKYFFSWRDRRLASWGKPANLATNLTREEEWLHEASQAIAVEP